MKNKKYFNYFQLSNKEKRCIIKTYKKGDVSCFFSNTIKQAEKAFSDYMGMPYAIATTNCTSALYLACKSLGITALDNIIIPNYTHPSSGFAVKMANINIKLCDSESDSYNMNLEHLKSLIDKNTKAIMFVHLRGLVQNIQEVVKICKEKKLFLIEDVAQGFGVKIGGKLAGSFGDIACFSFNDSKTLQLGEGGMCLFKNKKHEIYARKIIHEGEYAHTSTLSTTISNGTLKDVVEKHFNYIQDGFNFRPFPPIFSILPLRLKKIDKVKKKKLSLYKTYLNNLDKNRFKYFQITDDCFPICFPIIIKSKEDVVNILYRSYNSGYPIGKMAYSTLNKNKGLQAKILNKKDNFTNSESLFDRLIFLPLSNQMSKNDARLIINHLNNIPSVDECKKSFVTLNEFEKSEIKNFDGLYLW